MRYHWYLLSILTAPLAHLAVSLRPPWNDTRVKHMWDSIPTNWEYLGYPHPGTTIDLYIALKSCRENALIDALYEVSDPGHPKHVFLTSLLAHILMYATLFSRYGEHLSQEQVAELVAPHPATLELVNLWLEHNSVPPSSVSMTHGGNWLTVTGVPVPQASKLLGASYGLYWHAKTNETIVRTLGYALPAVLIPHVLTVAPTTFFASAGTLQQTPRRHPAMPTAKKAKATSRDPVKVLPSRQLPDYKVIPSDLRWLYNTFAYKPAATDRNALGIAGFLNEYPNQADLTKFMGEFREDALDADYTVEYVNGGQYNENLPGIEGNINIQYASAMAYPTPQIYYTIGGETQVYDDTGEPAPGDVFLEWFDFLSKQEKIPQTISTSYGTDEKDCPLEYAKALCDQFAQLGARGVSILYASGDDGVGAGDCKGDDGNVHFIPLFPASCTYGILSIIACSTSRSPGCHGFAGPFVTAVGGTMGIFPEVAASLSGGGFSNIFDRPPYQKKVVPDFLLKLGSKYAGLYKCIFCCDLTWTILTLQLVQRYWPRYPRHCRPGNQFYNRFQWFVWSREWHELRCTSASFLPLCTIVPRILSRPPLSRP